MFILCICNRKKSSNGLSFRFPVHTTFPISYYIWMMAQQQQQFRTLGKSIFCADVIAQAQRDFTSGSGSGFVYFRLRGRKPDICGGSFWENGAKSKDDRLLHAFRDKSHVRPSYIKHEISFNADHARCSFVIINENLEPSLKVFEWSARAHYRERISPLFSHAFRCINKRYNSLWMDIVSPTQNTSFHS